MDNKTIKYLAIGGGILFVVILWISYGISVQSEEVEARSRVEAQQKLVEAHHDSMWKILAQKAGISQQYKPSDYKELLAQVVEGRKGGSLVKTIKEQNPNFDLSLLKDLSQSVEGEHKIVVREEKKLLDYNRVHTNIIRNPWKKKFLQADQMTPIEVSVITSTRSKNAAATGVDDDVDLFKKGG